MGAQRNSGGHETGRSLVQQYPFQACSLRHTKQSLGRLDESSQRQDKAGPELGTFPQLPPGRALLAPEGIAGNNSL